jgi:hypothetical protein
MFASFINKAREVFHLKPLLKVFDEACRPPQDPSFMATNDSIIHRIGKSGDRLLTTPDWQ